MKCPQCKYNIKDIATKKLEGGTRQIFINCPECKIELTYYEDDFMRSIEDTWKLKGCTPIIINEMKKEGWYDEDIDEVFSQYVGKDYADINITVWVDRLEKNWGIKFPDGQSIYRILMNVLVNFYDNEYLRVKHLMH